MYKSIMNLLIIIVLAVLILSACSRLDKPVSSQAAKVKQSRHVVSINSYEIPKGIFRGVLWPNKDNKDFQVWLLDGSKEIFLKITAPSELMVETRDATKDWIIKKLGTTKDIITYSAIKNDGTKSVQFELPVRKTSYSFNILSNASGEEVLLFMNVAENVVDRGFFGYIVMKKQS